VINGNFGDFRNFKDENSLFTKFRNWSFQQTAHYFKSRYHVIADKSVPMTSFRGSKGFEEILFGCRVLELMAA
jgi:hypothetical protein